MATATQVKPVVKENQEMEVEPQTTPLPADYAALGVCTGYEPIPPEKTRHFILGPHGGGKTTFVSGIPEALILDFEDGAWGVPKAKAHRINVQTPQTLRAIVDKLIADGGPAKKGPYKRVVFDTVEQCLEVIGEELAEKYGVEDITQYGSHGAGYALLRNEFMAMLRRLARAGYAWTCVGHLAEKTVVVNNKERSVLRPVLYDSIAQSIARAADIVATIHSELEVEEVEIVQQVRGKTIRRRQSREVSRIYFDTQYVGQAFSAAANKRRGIPTFEPKLRMPTLEDEANGWDVFCEAYAKAVEAASNIGR